MELLGSMRRRSLLATLLLFILIVAVYWPVHTHGYMGADDYFYVVDNVHAHNGLNWPTVKWAFTAMDMVNWIPVTWLAHTVDYSLFGVDAAGHHMVNVILHALAAVLLFWMLKGATGFAGRSFMVAALFGLHPINVEPVAWVAELKTVLSMIFLVLALAAYRWYAARPGIVRYSAVALLYCLGLMAKSQIVMLPVLLLLWDYWPLDRTAFGFSPFALRQSLPAGHSGDERIARSEPPSSLVRRILQSKWRLLLEKGPLFFIALVDAVITLHVQGVARPEYWQYTWSIRLQNAAVAYVRYIGKALWPEWLSIYYPHPGNTLPWWQVAGACVLLAAITVLVLAARRRRYLVVGWFWFLISLFPMSGILHFGDQAMADRYAYQPFVGLFIMFCWGVTEWGQWIHLPKAALRGAAVVVLAALAVVTRHQVNLWGDNITLWSHALEISKDSPASEDMLAFDLIDSGRKAEALQHFRRAASLDPTDPSANLQIAFYEHQFGDLRRAAEYYEKVVHTPRSNDSERRRALINLGHVYGKLGDPTRARECFESAARIPEEQPAYR